MGSTLVISSRIGDDGTGGRTARHAGDAVVAAVTDEIADDQKIADEAGLLDDLQFQLKAVNDGLDGGMRFRRDQSG